MCVCMYVCTLPTLFLLPAPPSRYGTLAAEVGLLSPLSGCLVRNNLGSEIHAPVPHSGTTIAEGPGLAIWQSDPGMHCGDGTWNSGPRPFSPELLGHQASRGKFGSSYTASTSLPSPAINYDSWTSAMHWEGCPGTIRSSPNLAITR